MKDFVLDRENIVVRRAFNVAIGDNQRIGVYMHGKVLHFIII
jgi:hypothetical protein